ncbi:MAG: hypothetical protein UT58_C0012G0012 [Microgenomates group bacterium GW2011_GWC1_39_7b]|uniref:Uncharacterized protein n=3 Tax=Candidatus Woeseibacteriota TaxID=1752722 RepID=A0A0G0UU05_9BACT|nr:MAG: hypothetical protein UT17_C0001G0048 [Candidatus Woesebacteria bacterium GW2011_GWB1_39_10]KKR26457.1 MAG: hypothetical protein UT58_C0012G0012 [Microgenomates group bacterium GW2011_GWC1_39_7b]KKR73978.1 MAG: hypothetical protein UU16_C0008G0008 [Candidatus Woesebacteria bacterium GW2011_GWA2_40_7]KKR92234.1 MAG: hypothetical protein UU42_C0002G0048 [Candidatus Woesebacteria bacterium GW2011_GWA1_41_13b]
MSENNEQFDWKKTALKSVGIGLGAAGREIKRGVGRAVESGKEKATDLIGASRNVLIDYRNKAIEAFKNFPNKDEFAMASFLALAATQTVLLSVAAYNAPALEPSQRIMFAALNASFATIPASGSLAMFRDWVDRSNPAKSGSTVKE